MKTIHSLICFIFKNVIIINGNHRQAEDIFQNSRILIFPATFYIEIVYLTRGRKEYNFSNLFGRFVL